MLLNYLWPTSGTETGDLALFLRCLADSCEPADLPVFNVYLPAAGSQK